MDSQRRGRGDCALALVYAAVLLAPAWNATPSLLREGVRSYNEGFMPRRVYKFMSARYGLDNLSRRRLKLSTIDDLNDPFDQVAVDTTDPEVERLVDAYICNFRTRNGLLCFSRNWDNILLWSHYGASHTGVCLGFDIPDDHGLDVHYQPNLLSIRKPEDITETLMLAMLRTKHESWNYGQEVRLVVGINDQPDESGLCWFDFGPDLELKEVIAGVQCLPKDLKALGVILDTFAPSLEPLLGIHAEGCISFGPA